MAKKHETAYTRYRRNLMSRIRRMEKKGWEYSAQKPLTEKQLRKQGTKLGNETRRIKKQLKEFEKEVFVTEWGEMFTVKESRARRINPTLPETNPSIIEEIKKRISELHGTRYVNSKGKGARGKYIDLDNYGLALIGLIEYAQEVTEPILLEEHYRNHEESIFENLNVLMYDSDQGNVESAYTLILGVLKNAPTSIEEAKRLEELAEEAWEFE